jgi:hypothetical protein
MTVVRRRKGRVTSSHPARLLSAKPLYVTNLGAAYAGDSLDLIKLLPARSVNAIITSPPYALHFKKFLWKSQSGRICRLVSRVC